MSRHPPTSVLYANWKSFWDSAVDAGDIIFWQIWVFSGFTFSANALSAVFSKDGDCEP